jgi:Fe-S-cluster containining protein
MEDEYELEQDLHYKDIISPMELAEKKFNDIYKRNHKLYLESIEWDTWCVKLDEETIQEQVKQREIDTHPFNKFF